MIKNILGVLLVIALAFFAIYGFIAMIEFGIQRHEKVECQRWAKYAEEFQDFYFTNWQIAQCDAHGF